MSADIFFKFFCFNFREKVHQNFLSNTILATITQKDGQPFYSVIKLEIKQHHHLHTSKEHSYSERFRKQPGFYFDKEN